MSDLTADQAKKMRAARERAAAENRARYPELAKDVDLIREVFPGARVTYLGKPRKESLEHFDEM